MDLEIQQLPTADNIVRVLLIDDDRQQFLLIGFLLSQIRSTEYRLLWCSDLDEGLINVEHQQCDIVLFDYHRGLDSTNFMDRVKDMPYRVPIILMTDGMDLEVDQTAISHGAADYLVKDTVNPEILERSIRYSIERKKIEQHLKHLAHHDYLTGLPNRVLFSDRLNQAISLSQRIKTQVTLMYIDLNNFKEVNDNYGHSVGDLLLKEFAVRLQSCVRRSDTVARIGGDEFTVILNNIGSKLKITYIAKKILEKMALPFFIHKKVFEIGCSIGIAVYPDTSESVELLQRNADSAMYQAKNSGISCYCFFNVPHQRVLPIQIISFADIKKIIEDGKFHSRYFPRIDLKSKKIIAMTANPIVFENSEKEGESYISLVKFLSNHESINFLTYWVVEKALCDLHDLYQEQKVIISFPVRKELLLSSKFYSFVKSKADAKNIDFSNIEFSLIKNTDGEESVYFEECINNINRAGAKFCISDFGESVLNLVNVYRGNILFLCLSESFLQAATFNKKDKKLLQAVIALAHSLEKKIIVNNVMDRSQLEDFSQMGCDVAQGGVVNDIVKHHSAEKLFPA